MRAAMTAPEKPKTFHVKSFGCQMNVYDGERMAELMAADGMTATADPDAADLVVLNTCHIRDRATEKVYSDIGRLRKKIGSDRIETVRGLGYRLAPLTGESEAA